MKRWAVQKGSLVRFTAIGLAVGLVGGLVEILMLRVVDLAHPAPRDMLCILVAYGLLGLLGGLAWGLVQGRRAPTERAASVQEAEERGKRRWAHLKWSLLQGMGAGLVAGGVVGLIEIVGLILVDRSWQPLDGLLHATIAYGMLGLLGGLVLGLLRGLWCTWRGCAASTGSRPAWVAFSVLIVSVGAFLVVHNRVRRDVLDIPNRKVSLIESLVIDEGFLIAAILLAIGLWFLLRRLARRARLVQLRWNLGLYVMLVLMAALVSGAPRFADTLVRLKLATNLQIPPDLRDRPNVIFIVAETLRADRLGCYGHDGHLTPSLDALAQDGVLYRQMGAQAPWTKPSVATMLSSLYPTSHGANLKERILPDGVITLPEVLSFSGYRTAGFTTNIQTAPEFNFDQGYDEYAFLTTDPPALAFGSWTASRFAVFAVLRRLLWISDSPMVGVYGLKYREASSVNQEVLDWLEVNGHSRFFLFLHYFDPHDPYYAHPYDGTMVWKAETPFPDPAQAPYLNRLYNGEIAYLDDHLGKLFGELKARRLYDEMLIVFTSDHGEEFYKHGGWWHGESLYEKLLAVPLIVKYPGNAHAGLVDEELARSLDLAPTVLDVAGLPIPDVMQGVSLRPGATVNRAESIFAEADNAGEMRSIRTHKDKLIVVDRDYLRPLPSVALFALEQDPGEQKNLAQDEPNAVRVLRAELDQVTAFAEAHALAARSEELDDTTRDLLRQIGY